MTTPFPTIPSPEEMAWAKAKLDAVMAGTYELQAPPIDESLPVSAPEPFAFVEGIGPMTEVQFYDYLLRTYAPNNRND